MKNDFVFYRDFKHYHPIVERGEGIYIYDKNGKKYIDACSGALVSNLGHGIKEIAEAIYEQAQKIAFAHLSMLVSEPAIELALLLKDLAPGDLNYTWFVSGGSEAVESAIKLARQYFLERDSEKSSKYKIIGRWNSFHGNTLGALAIGGHISRRKPYIPMFMEFPHINPHYCYRCPFKLEYPSCDLRCAFELEDVVKREGAQYIAAFIAEPVVGATVGALVPPPEYWPIVREICDKYDILLIADEVMTGLGRTGENFAVNHWKVIPDMIVLGKGMSAGYSPLAGVIVSEKITETIKKGSGRFIHGHTYGGNPLSCATGVAVLKYILKHNLIENVKNMGAYLETLLRKDLCEIPIIGDIRGIGLMWGIEIVKDKNTKEPFPRSVNAISKVTNILTEMGLLVYPGSGAADGIRGDHFMIAPPFTLKEEEAIEIVHLLREGLKKASEILLRE
ncbi:MAG: aspartate aminotransferase family protein [Synergistetes bacterium]|nr:aspartate aminotransferase family protein [Synergistota bacterium]MCX8128128.1 aspartate aminotransferase family protein [Synergistota bacterium]MDW8192504.1 aspartate aminotransferase family protein [Synergistota bacterium]